MPRPNIILILTDHFRRDALGKSTPNLLALANAGTRFENAYCNAPLCGPSRVSLITGLYPSQHGVCGNQAEPIHDDLRDDTFMHHLQRAGYYTAMIGKHHYIDRYGLHVDATEDTDEIRRYGFDHVFIVLDDGENGHNDDEYTHHLRRQGKLETFRAALANRADPFAHPFEADESADGFIGLHGVRFVENYQGDKPFYLNLSFIGPHPPLWHPNESTHDPIAMPAPIGAPDDLVTRTRRAHYMDKCALIDDYVGRLVTALKQRGLYENTVFIFTSDHGDNLGDYGIWDKRFFYEQSVGVPLFLSGPGVPAGERHNGPRISRALVTHQDLYPTILRLAGAQPGPRRRMGRDLLAILNGAPGHDAAYAELATCVMIRTGNWKLVFDPEQGGVQYLFNLAVDPQEQHNLAGVAGYEAVTLDLMQRLLAYRIRLTQYTHVKEEQRLQRVRVG
ncbi:MAG TPA: sulfatase-like hydrolase/transferase [Spirillospora sp.]|nr:sulfatase-like hydrolase/transferase [Spirillospora sp.]